MNEKFILVIDQGTTSSRVVLISHDGEVKYKEQMAVNIYQCENGAIRQNAKEILDTVRILITRILAKNKISENNIIAIGITNQRETVVIWDKITGEPLDDAISWQSKETSDITNKLVKDGYTTLIKEKTGLTISPYFSASKIMRLINTHENNTNILVGTIDSYLLYNLSEEKNHYTDYTNASRTMLFNINTLKWDEEILSLLKIPKDILPKVMPSDSEFGHLKINKTLIPILSLVGDQQSSLIGHQCFYKGQVKATYGTGAFILLNTGSMPYYSKNGLLTTIASAYNGEVRYALEGSIFICGAAIEWLKDDLNLLNDPRELGAIINTVLDDDIYFVPAFVGLGTPYWDNEVRGAFFGLKRKTSKADLIKATLRAITFEVEDVLKVLKNETKLKLTELSTDGGVAKCEYLLQEQASISNIRVNQSSEPEITALGAGYIAGLKAGFWSGISEIEQNKQIKKIFYPRYNGNKRKELYTNWQQAIKASRTFKIKRGE